MVHRATLNVTVNGVQKLFTQSIDIPEGLPLEPGTMLTWHVAGLPGDPQYHNPGLFVTVHFAGDDGK